MKNMDDHYFEEHFREAFSDFEAQPSKQAWNNIQSSIPAQEGNRLLKWQSVAMAAIFIAMPILLGDITEESMSPEMPRTARISGAMGSNEKKQEPLKASSDQHTSDRGTAIDKKDTISYADPTHVAQWPTPKTWVESEIRHENQRHPLLLPTLARNGIAPESAASLPLVAVNSVLVPSKKPSVVDTETVSSGRLVMYLNITSFLGYQRHSPSPEDLVVVRQAENLASFHLDRLGFQGSWGVELPVSHRLQLSAGLLYQFRPQQSSLELTSWEQHTATLVEDGLQLTPQFQTSLQEYAFQFHSLGTSMLVWYSLSPKHRQQPQLGWGGQVLRVLNPTTDPVLHQPIWQPMLTAAYRVAYPLKPGWSLHLQPTLSYSVLSGKYRRGLLSTQTYFFGIGIQLNY